MKNESQFTWSGIGGTYINKGRIFFNPGKPHEGLTVEKLISGDYVSYIRNKQIAYVFKEAGLIEKYGSGIKRIFNAFNKSNLKDSELKFVQNGFLITIGHF